MDIDSLIILSSIQDPPQGKCETKPYSNKKLLNIQPHSQIFTWIQNNLFII